MREIQRVVIVGGGFGGVTAALKLSQLGKSFDVTLISDKTHFEYHAALYRVVTGRSPLEVCIPLSDIFEGTTVKVIHDTITKINPKNQHVYSANYSYEYDFLVLATGSTTQFHDIPGLEKYSYPFKSINDALKIKRHLHEQFAQKNTRSTHDAIHVVIAGGGATGVELAGELSVYTKKLAKKHHINPSRVVIDLFESGSRLLSNTHRWASQAAYNRLHTLGINIFLNTPITKEDFESIYLPTAKLKTKTLIWTAGVKAQIVSQKIPGIISDRHGRIEVSESLEAKKLENVFIIGDAASTQYSGMAQTAIYDAEYITSVIRSRSADEQEPSYVPPKPYLCVPIGPGWALVDSVSLRATGKTGWTIRRLADLRLYLKILPFTKALTAFQDGKRLSETCPVCSREET